jgi:hypothetical protein
MSDSCVVPPKTPLQFFAKKQKSYAARDCRLCFSRRNAKKGIDNKEIGWHTFLLKKQTDRSVLTQLILFPMTNPNASKTSMEAKNTGSIWAPKSKQRQPSKGITQNLISTVIIQNPAKPKKEVI